MRVVIHEVLGGGYRWYIHTGTGAEVAFSSTREFDTVDEAARDFDDLMNLFRAEVHVVQQRDGWTADEVAVYQAEGAH